MRLSRLESKTVLPVNKMAAITDEIEATVGEIVVTSQNSRNDKQSSSDRGQNRCGTKKKVCHPRKTRERRLQKSMNGEANNR